MMKRKTPLANHIYRLNRKTLYLDRKVFEKVSDLKINFDEIQKEAVRLKVNGNPSPTYNTAAMFLIDRKNAEVVKSGLLAMKKTEKKDSGVLGWNV